MTFEVEVNGQLRVVSVEAVGASGPSGGRFRLLVHDAALGDDPAPSRGDNYEVDARRVVDGVSLVYPDDRRSVDASVIERPGGEYLVQLPRVTLIVTVDGRRSRRDSTGEGRGKGEQRIVAPMPGRVVRVLVKKGDRVSARQGLVVVEAMKMENELAAARDGTVTEVAVSEGTSVEAGRLLVRVE
jgi:biotin carboxyl carrier protein